MHDMLNDVIEILLKKGIDFSIERDGYHFYVSANNWVVHFSITLKGIIARNLKSGNVQLFMDVKAAMDYIINN